MRTVIAGWERVLLVVLGIGLVVAAVLVFGGTEVAGYCAFAVVGALLGADLAVTGAIGFCPLYRTLDRGAAATAGDVR